MTGILQSRSSRKPLCTVIVVLGLACAFPNNARPGDAASTDFIRQLNSGIDRATASSSDRRVAAQSLCDDLSRSMLDLETMMKNASADAWRTMDLEQREMYRTAFRRRIIHDCSTRAFTYLQTSIELAGVRTLPNGEKFIGTRAQASTDGRVLMWKVRSKAPGKLLVTDVVIDGRSAVLNMREQASLSLERSPGDISAVIGSLER